MTMMDPRDPFKILVFSAAVAVGIAASPRAVSDIGFHAEQTVRQWTDGDTSCSIVVIAPGEALTAAHCADLAAIGAVVNGLAVTAVEVAPDGKDVARITVPGLACPCAKPASAPAEIGDTVYAVGYPYGLPTRVVTSGAAQGLYQLLDDGQVYMVATVAVRPGSSGGGVFNEDGLLLGLISRGDAAGAILLYVELK